MNSPSFRRKVARRGVPFSLSRLLCLRLCLASGLFLGGCLDGFPSGNTPAPSEETGDGDGHGNATCDDWKDAYCSYHNDCGNASFSECFSTIDDVECQSSAPLESCVEKLTLGCESAPSECDLSEIADTIAAQEGCDAFAEAFCASRQICQPSGDESACYSTVRFEVSCPTTYALGPTFNSCMRVLEDESCETELPAECVGMIYSQ